MTDDGDNAGRDHSVPGDFLDGARIESVHDHTVGDDLTVDSSASHTIPQPADDTDRGAVPSGTVEVHGGPIHTIHYPARYGADGGFTDALRRVARHAGADRLTVVRLPGVRRINAYYLHTDVDALAETLARLDRQTPVDGITPLSLGAHAIVRLDFHVDHDGEGADGDGSELLYPTGDGALDAAVLDGGSP